MIATHRLLTAGRDPGRTPARQGADHRRRCGDGGAVRRVLRAIGMPLLLAMGVGISAAQAQALSLDEIYRDALREENAGSLPGYVLNRGMPPYPEPKPPVPGAAGSVGPSVVDLPLAAPMPWPEVLKSIAGGSPSPFAVDAVRRRAERDDPQAIELLAWMYTNGVGVKRNLGQAFDLYVKADSLGVGSAKDNAKAVLKAMPVAERRTVFNPFN